MTDRSDVEREVVDADLALETDDLAADEAADLFPVDPEFLRTLHKRRMIDAMEDAGQYIDPDDIDFA